MFVGPPTSHYVLWFHIKIRKQQERDFELFDQTRNLLQYGPISGGEALTAPELSNNSEDRRLSISNFRGGESGNFKVD